MRSRPNPFAYGQPITLESLDDLFAHHRVLTGGWKMEGGNDPGADPGNDPAKVDPPSFEAITSQEQLDKVLGARLAREREKFADYEELRRKAAEHDAAAEAAKTEAEKAIDAARKEGETAATAAANARIVRAEAKAAAATAKFRDPEVAVRLLDLAGVTVADDGTVDAAALKTKLDTLAAEHPYLVDDGKTVVTPPKPDPSQGGGGGGDEKPGSIAEARRKAREEREARAPKSA